MAPFVLESWRGTTRGLVANQSDTAAIRYQVGGYTSSATVLAAVQAYSDYSIGASYNAMDANEPLVCNAILPPDWKSAIYCEVLVTFAVPSQGFFQPTGMPLTLPWKYSWSPCIEQPEVDRDVSNNPILNSAYDAPSTHPTRTVTKRVLKIRRNEAFYDMATYSTYENTVNSDTIELVEPNGNTVTFNPGDMKCVSIAPEREYTQADTFVTIELTFEVYIPNEISVTQPFQLHILDSGLNSFAGASSEYKGRILYQNDEEKPDDSLLDGKGGTIDPALQTAGPDGAALPNQDNPDESPPPGATIETCAAGGPYQAVFLRYDQYASIPFLPILNSTST